MCARNLNCLNKVSERRYLLQCALLPINLMSLCHRHHFPGLLTSFGALLQFVQQLRLQNLNFDCNIEVYRRCLQTLRSFGRVSVPNWRHFQYRSYLASPILSRLSGVVSQISEANSAYFIDLFMFFEICTK